MAFSNVFGFKRHLPASEKIGEKNSEFFKIDVLTKNMRVWESVNGLFKKPVNTNMNRKKLEGYLYLPGCQGKIPNAKTPNMTTYPKYSQYFIHSLTLLEQLFSITLSKFSIGHALGEMDMPHRPVGLDMKLSKPKMWLNYQFNFEKTWL